MRKQASRHFFQMITLVLALALVSCGDGNNDSGVRKPPIYMWVSARSTVGDIGGYSSNGANEFCAIDAKQIEFHTEVTSH